MAICGFNFALQKMMISPKNCILATRPAEPVLVTPAGFAAPRYDGHTCPASTFLFALRFKPGKEWTSFLLRCDSWAKICYVFTLKKHVKTNYIKSVVSLVPSYTHPWHFWYVGRVLPKLQHNELPEQNMVPGPVSQNKQKSRLRHVDIMYLYLGMIKFLVHNFT